MLATSLELVGFVRNNANGVTIEIEGIKKRSLMKAGFFSSYPNDSAIALGQAAWGISNKEPQKAEEQKITNFGVRNSLFGVLRF